MEQANRSSLDLPGLLQAASVQLSDGFCCGCQWGHCTRAISAMAVCRLAMQRALTQPRLAPKPRLAHQSEWVVSCDLPACSTSPHTQEEQVLAW